MTNALYSALIFVQQMAESTATPTPEDAARAAESPAVEGAIDAATSPAAKSAIDAATSPAAKEAAKGAAGKASEALPQDTAEMAGAAKEEVVGFVGKIVGFFKYDFFPNLWMWMTLVFMLVIAVVIFAGITLVVRTITDPIIVKVFRMDESTKIPALVGGVLSVVVAIFAFQWFYDMFPALHPPIAFLKARF
ncbi:hypothetical protein K8I61_16840 [bacterium]|nr:hypothetical protein [bacterium]